MESLHSWVSPVYCNTEYSVDDVWAGGDPAATFLATLQQWRSEAIVTQLRHPQHIHPLYSPVLTAGTTTQKYISINPV